MLSEFTLAWENITKNVMCSSFSSSFTNNYPFKRRRYIFKNEQMKKRFSLSLHRNFISPKYVFVCFVLCYVFFCKQEMFFSANSLFWLSYQPRNVYTHLWSICYRTDTFSLMGSRWENTCFHACRHKQKRREEKQQDNSIVFWSECRYWFGFSSIDFFC